MILSSPQPFLSRHATLLPNKRLLTFEPRSTLGRSVCDETKTAVSETSNDPARFQHYFFMGGGGVFVVVIVFKNFILKLDMVMSIFLTFLSKIVARVCNTEKKPCTHPALLGVNRGFLEQ